MNLEVGDAVKIRGKWYVITDITKDEEPFSRIITVYYQNDDESSFLNYEEQSDRIEAVMPMREGLNIPGVAEELERLVQRRTSKEVPPRLINVFQFINGKMECLTMRR